MRMCKGMLEKLRPEIELIGRHLEVVRAVVEDEPIGIMKLAEVLALPYHRVRYSLRVLEQLGYIQATPAGARATPEAIALLAGLDGEIDDLIILLNAMKTGEAGETGSGAGGK
jgi:predicted transcriptional regulator